MIDGPFREKLPHYVQPLLRFYRFIRISPNQVTLTGAFFGLLSAYLVYQSLFVTAVACWWLGRLFDGTDGIYARSLNRASHFGAFLDINLDMLIYSVMIIAFSLIFPEHMINWLIILFLYIMCTTGALSLGQFKRNKSESRDNRGIKLTAGIAEGGETGLAYTAFLLFPQFIHILSNGWIIILSTTVLARFVLAYKELHHD